MIIENTEKLKAIVNDICNWNAQRYDQKFCAELTDKLLAEEASELYSAMQSKDEVEQVDALADIFYIAIGALWKHKNSQDEILTTLDIYLNTRDICADLNVLQGLLMPLTRAAQAAGASLARLIDKYDERFALNVISAVCKSNNTKKVEKVEANVKANLDKGKNYVPPTNDIKMYLNNFNKEN